MKAEPCITYQQLGREGNARQTRFHRRCSRGRMLLRVWALQSMEILSSFLRQTVLLLPQENGNAPEVRKAANKPTETNLKGKD
jgi:hypothetical protein